MTAPKPPPQEMWAVMRGDMCNDELIYMTPRPGTAVSLADFERANCSKLARVPSPPTGHATEKARKSARKR